MRSTAFCGTNTAIPPLPFLKSSSTPRISQIITSPLAHTGASASSSFGDSAGVIEQVETETCKLIPTTFTVQSRPESAPYKQHRYFLSTPYSFAKFGGWKSKEVNVKDLN